MAVDDEAAASENTTTTSRSDRPVVDRPVVGRVVTGRVVTGRTVSGSVIVLLLVAVAVLGYLLWQDHRQDELRRTATEDAARLVVQLATYDHTDVDANLDAVVAEATPGFADRYREVSDGLRDLLSSGEGTSTGTVSHAAVESFDDDTAVVLVFLDQEVSNVTVPDGRIDSSRMVVTVVRDGNRWLLDDAQLA